MNLTTKGRYAVMAMVDLALHGNSGPVTLADIALRQGIALNYLEQIFMKLRKSGLVSSVLLANIIDETAQNVCGEETEIERRGRRNTRDCPRQSPA